MNSGSLENITLILAMNFCQPPGGPGDITTELQMIKINCPLKSLLSPLWNYLSSLLSSNPTILKFYLNHQEVGNPRLPSFYRSLYSKLETLALCIIREQLLYWALPHFSWQELFPSLGKFISRTSSLFPGPTWNSSHRRRKEQNCFVLPLTKEAHLMVSRLQLQESSDLQPFLPKHWWEKKKCWQCLCS